MAIQSQCHKNQIHVYKHDILSITKIMYSLEFHPYCSHGKNHNEKQNKQANKNTIGIRGFVATKPKATAPKATA